MKRLLFLLTGVVLLSSCKKDVEELPAPTETGANTFGARVDGQIWVPQKFGIAPTAALVEARYGGNNTIFINARNFASSPTETEFEIYLMNVTGPGTILLNTNTGHYPSQSASYAYYIKRKFMPLNEWITSSQHTGSVTITRYDTVNGIIAGTFEFRAGSVDNTADPVTVTEGRFDVKIQ